MDNFGHIYLYVFPNTPLQGREKEILGVKSWLLWNFGRAWFNAYF